MTLLLLYPWELIVDDTTLDLNLTGVAVVDAPPHMVVLQVVDPRTTGTLTVLPPPLESTLALVTAQAILQVATKGEATTDLEHSDVVAAVVRALTASGIAQVVSGGSVDMRVEPRATATVRSD